MAKSPVEICNMALSLIGNYGTVTNIENPTNDVEITCSIWYDISRQNLLRNTMPNFSLKRQMVAKSATNPTFGYANAFDKPSDMLKFLGIDNTDLKRTNFAVEGDFILTDEDYDGALPIRYISDVTDTTKFPADWSELLAHYIATKIVMQISQDVNKKQELINNLPILMSTVGSLNSQENPPIRVSYSRFQGARHTDFPTSVNKK